MMTRAKQALVAMGTVAAVAAAGIWFSHSPSSGSPNSLPAPIPTVTGYAELMTGAASVTEMVAKATIAVRARATTSERQVPRADDPTLVLTHQHFEVLQQYWGPAKAGDTLSVPFTGGLVESGLGAPYMLMTEGQPQFQDGHEYVLLLIGPTPSGEYFSFGGSQGRYEIVGDKLQAVPGTAEAGSIQATLDGNTVAGGARLLLTARP